MTPSKHILTSLIISFITGFSFKSIGCFTISFIAGVFIDIDHILDFYIENGFTINMKSVYAAHYNRSLQKIFIVLHSYELLILLWSIIIILSLNKFWIAAAIGLTQHIILDQFTNPVNKLSYFFTYRASKGFKRELLTYKTK